MLVTVLQQDFGVHYNPERISDVDFTKSKDLFIHGMIDCDNGGTCVSMPVLYTAVAQRLGYPVYLVHAKKHVFCRWDAEDDRVNIEGSSRGLNSYDDEHYMTWPDKIEPSEVRDGDYLKSLTPSEAFAGFLASRGHCLEDNKLYPEARATYAMAHKAAPTRKIYRAFLRNLMRVITPGDVPHLMDVGKQAHFSGTALNDRLPPNTSLFNQSD